MTNAVTPTVGLTTVVAVGGQSYAVIPSTPNGGFITNPLLAADQSITIAEVLYVDPVGNATTTANGTTFALQPGQTWTVIPGQTTPTTVTSVTPGHTFSAVSY